MMIKHLLLATIAATLGVGCVGELEPMPGNPPPTTTDDPPSQDTEAKVMYDTNVAPIMTNKCGSCHTAGRPVSNTSGFVDSDSAKAYDTMVHHVSLVGNFTADSAPILTKISNGHNAIVYTQAELTAITDWLDKEVELRNPGTTPTNPTPTPTQETASQATKRLYKEWSGCMTRTDFDTANMAQGVGAWQATNNQECDNCHATGGEGFVASRDGTFFFKVITEHTAYLSQYFTVDLTQGVPAAKVVMNRTSFDGVSQRKAPHTEHPTFDATDNGQGIQAISQFYTLTAAHATNPATCEVPAGRLVD